MEKKNKVNLLVEPGAQMETKTIMQCLSRTSLSYISIDRYTYRKNLLKDWYTGWRNDLEPTEFIHKSVDNE